jgi:hypothetical protein
MSTITQSGPNMPDFTAPVSSIGRNKFIGVVGNMDNGTAKGNLTNGNANNNIGGTVFRAAGQSSNQFPVSAADAINTGSGGSAPQPTNSSQNPLTVQAQTLNRVTTESVTQTTPALVSSASAGNYLTFPKSTEEILLDKDTSSAVHSDLVVQRTQPANAYVGITNTLYNDGVNDLQVLAEEARVVNDTNPTTMGHVDGADNQNVPIIYPSGQQLYTITQREALPGGVAISPEIGETNVSGLGL